MIELNQVTKRYGQASVLKNITLTIDEPGIYCLLGRNGAGKTTLLKSVAGYQNITSGSIRVDGREITTSTLDTGVSYIENFAKHFNLPVRKLLKIASEVNPSYDYDFASEMMERFELDGKKKFYDMLTESFKKHPRIIIVSTHIIEEIAKAIEKLIIIDKGSIRFFDTLQSVETKAFSVSGLQSEVEAATRGLKVIGQDTVGGLVTCCIFDTPPQESASIEVRPLSLQDFFIQMVGHKAGAKR